jgi:hypothetical protein
MKDTIFYLEGRGGLYLYHFFIYNLGGLFYILNKQYCIRGQTNSSIVFNDKSKLVPYPSTEIVFPIKIHMKDIIPFQREAFEILKDKFILIEDLSVYKDYEIISIYGEVQVNSGTCDNRINIFPFLRNLFFENVNFDIIKGKRIYISRKYSYKQHNGILKRACMNEDTLILMLQKYNFEYIQLENYNMYEKIKLFMESEIIISPHSSALTLTLFSNKNTNIIELLNRGQGVNHSQMIEISQILGLKFNRYTNIYEDSNGNFTINVNEFEKYLINLL